MKYEKSIAQDYMLHHQTIAAKLRDMLPAKTMESFAKEEIDRFQLSAYAMFKFMDALQPESKTAFNMAALGFQQLTGREFYFRNSKSVELSSPQEALVLPIRGLSPSEKTRLTVMTSYSTARDAIVTGIGATLAVKNGMILEADRFQDLGKSGLSALMLTAGLGLTYFGGKSVVKKIPQIFAAAKASHIGVAVSIPDQPDMTYTQIAESLNDSYAFVY